MPNNLWLCPKCHTPETLAADLPPSCCDCNVPMVAARVVSVAELEALRMKAAGIAVDDDLMDQLRTKITAIENKIDHACVELKAGYGNRSPNATIREAIEILRGEA